MKKLFLSAVYTCAILFVSSAFAKDFCCVSNDLSKPPACMDVPNHADHQICQNVTGWEHVESVENRKCKADNRCPQYNPTKLSSLHQDCKWPNAQTAECLSAIHSYVRDQGLGDAGVAQEIGNNVYAVGAFEAMVTTIDGRDLTKEVASCRSDGGSPYAWLRSFDCTAAIHRTCFNRFHYGAGFPQEHNGWWVGIACVNPGWYGNISQDELTGLHPDCQWANPISNGCMSAIRQACNKRGFGMGFPQELGDRVYGVVCLNPSWYGEVKVN